MGGFVDIFICTANKYKDQCKMPYLHTCTSLVIRHLLQRQLLLRWYLRQQRVRVRVMIGFLVRGRVRIKIRVRVRVMFNVRVYHWSNCGANVGHSQVVAFCTCQLNCDLIDLRLFYRLQISCRCIKWGKIHKLTKYQRLLDENV